MIVVYHNSQRVTGVVTAGKKEPIAVLHTRITHCIMQLARDFPNEVLVWCHEQQRDNLNESAIESLFHHHKLLFSYNPGSGNFLGRELGYIEDSPFVNVAKHSRYATWQMSSAVGAVHASILNACSLAIELDNDFDYFLNSLAKRAMGAGLFCYSEPRLLKAQPVAIAASKATLSDLFRFARQHYKLRWIFLLAFNLMIYEKRLPIAALLRSLFYGKRSFDATKLNQIPLQSSRKTVETGTIDVLIPTIGRKEYLRAVLENLAVQTHLPATVIVIEQNPEAGSRSNLDFLTDTSWPFAVKHRFTHQTGACNARNIGLALLESEFCFMADDDIVFGNDLLEKAMASFKSTGSEAFLVCCHLQSQQPKPEQPKQFGVFGAGHAFVKTSCVKDLRFRMGYEFGFGEDNDFGMQLRQKGVDILYISTAKILHLKAPIGGFRSKPVLKWQLDKIQPKPSPTVMLFRLLYDSQEQLLGYKTTLFLKNLGKDFFWNPFGYVKRFQQKWQQSIFWATKLKEE